MQCPGPLRCSLRSTTTAARINTTIDKALRTPSSSGFSRGEPEHLISPSPRPPKARQIGLLGGSFNPIHHAHLFSAEAAAAALGLERVLLIPAHQSPLKASIPVATDHRVAMARLAAAGNPLLEVSTVDVDRPPPSYTVETVTLLGKRYPDAELYLILGLDALPELLEWREPERLLDLCRVIVLSRPGYRLAMPPAVTSRLGARARRVHLHPIPELNISSTDLRRRFQMHEPVRYLLPEAVERYIREHELYGPAQEAVAGAGRTSG